MLKRYASKYLPNDLVNRKDKMGFPVPINKWLLTKGRTYEFVYDLLSSRRSREREYLSGSLRIDDLINADGQYGRCLWALLSLELWQRQALD